MNLIIFDFDGTIAKSSDYHRQGWEKTMKQLNIHGGLNAFLPYEEGLKERFDSYRRIQSGITRSREDFESLISYFNTTDINSIAKGIMDIKESHTITSILKDKTENAVARLGNGIIDFLETLVEDTENVLAIISSSRKTIISAYLYKTGLINFFEIIIGEEDMYKNRVLVDKPNRFAFDQLLKSTGKTKFKSVSYIGDDDLIDREFSDNINAVFFKAKYDANFLNINIFE